MKLEIDGEFADEIVRQSLLDTYINLSDDLENQINLHEDDLIRYKETVAAIEALGQWYFFDFKGEVKKALEKRKKK
jgi:hypothetical protein